MTRPRKNTVDYFPHDVKHGKTITILKNQFGNDGYAFWFQLLELLGDADGHYYKLDEVGAWDYLAVRTGVTPDKAKQILGKLAELSAIDGVLLGKKIIWCQNLVDRVADVYLKNRKRTLPQKPDAGLPTEKTSDLDVITPKKPLDDRDNLGVLPPDNPQSKVKESKVFNTLVEQARPDSVQEIFEFWQKELGHSKSKLDDARAKAIKARLKAGYSVERIKQAILGIKKSPHHMGENDRGTRFDDIELICRSGKNVDQFADLLDQSVGPLQTEKRARDMFAKLLTHVRRHGSNTKIPDLDNLTREALHRIGGLCEIANSNNSKLPMVERAFIESWLKTIKQGEVADG